MVTKQRINSILSEKRIALVGLSRKKGSFSRAVFKELKKKGMTLVPINPNTKEIEGETCYPDISSLPEPAGAAIIMTPKAQSLEAVKQAADAGIKKIWLQQGADSKEAAAYLKEQNIEGICKECVLMFAEPAGGIHRFHRFLKGLFRKLPEN